MQRISISPNETKTYDPNNEVYCLTTRRIAYFWQLIPTDQSCPPLKGCTACGSTESVFDTHLPIAALVGCLDSLSGYVKALAETTVKGQTDDYRQGWQAACTAMGGYLSRGKPTTLTPAMQLALDETLRTYHALLMALDD